jgi:hypothetical protein
VVCCGRRFGKDILGIDLSIEMALTGFPVGWFQPTYKSLLEVWRACKRILAPITASASEQDKRLELITGGVIEFWSLDNDPEAARGRKYKRIVINEAAKVRELQTAWEQAIRATLADYKGDAWLLSTPRGRDYFWELWNRGTVENLEFPRWRSWQKPTAENPHIDPEEIEDLRADMPTDVFNAEILAQFLDVGGRFFDEWEPETTDRVWNTDASRFVETKRPWHVVDPFPIPDWWNAWGAIDYGTNPTVPTFYFLLLAANEFGDVVAVDEVYAAGLIASEQAQRVLECLERHGMAAPADERHRDGLWKTRLKLLPMDWANTFPPETALQKLGKYPAEHYWDRGLNVIPAVKDRTAGWAEVKQWMHDTRRVRDDYGEESVVPRFRVMKGRCANMIRTIPLLLRDAKNSEDLDTTLEDHPADTLRYGLMTRPRPSVKPQTPKVHLPHALQSTRETEVYE